MTSALARCHGYVAVAADGVCGVVETPVFAPESSEPDFLVLRAGAGARSELRIVAAALVDEVDEQGELVLLRLTREDVRRLPGHLPVAT